MFIDMVPESCVGAAEVLLGQDCCQLNFSALPLVGLLLGWVDWL